MSVYKFSVPFEFPLHFTRGVFDRRNPLLKTIVARLEPARRHRLLVVVDERVAASNPHLHDTMLGYAAEHATSIELVAPPVIVPGGEAVKNDIEHALSLLKVINDAGLDRHSYVVIVGGGAVLDMASFAAAIAHRGIRVVRVPTTVLAQADSGVGVKNSINLFGKKNFAGTFVPPFAVINDLDFLHTLEPRDRIAGVIEAVKVALLKDPAFFDDIAANASRVTSDYQVLRRVIERSAELHLQHICGNGDPFELGSARPLDFGHWAAHKLESMTAPPAAPRRSGGDRHRARRLLLGAEGHPRSRVGHPDYHRARADRIPALGRCADHAGARRRLFADRRVARVPGAPRWRAPHHAAARHWRQFEVTEMDERLILESIEDLAKLRPANIGR